MSIYHFAQSAFARRRHLGGLYAPLELEKCSTCGATPPVPDSHKKYVELDQGNFVSNILWSWGDFHVTEGLKDAFQKEGFEGIAFEPTKIVKDNRPSKDRRKLPLEQIPQFYRVKYLSVFPLHHDFINMYEVQCCPQCGIFRSKRQIEPYILDERLRPGTDFFVIPLGYVTGCSEKGKTFLENYPKTYCYFTQCELRD